MEPQQNSNKTKIIIAVLIFALAILVILYRNVTAPRQSTVTISPTLVISPDPTFVQITQAPITPREAKPLEQLPTLPPSQGQGTDINSPQVQASRTEIAKLSPSFPYEKNIRTSNGVEATVIISQFQDSDWMLLVSVFGVDYQVPQNDPQYPVMKKAFQEAVLDTYNWMRSKNADPQNIIISWGDREFIRNRAEEWLR